MNLFSSHRNHLEAINRMNNYMLERTYHSFGTYGPNTSTDRDSLTGNRINVVVRHNYVENRKRTRGVQVW